MTEMFQRKKTAAEASQIQTYDFVREPHQRNLTKSQMTCFVLWQKEVCCTK